MRIAICRNLARVRYMYCLLVFLLLTCRGYRYCGVTIRINVYRQVATLVDIVHIKRQIVLLIITPRSALLDVLYLHARLRG